MKGQNESCSAAYKNNSLLCAACAAGLSHSGLGDACEECPDEGANTAIAVTGVFAGIIALFVFVRVTLSDKGKVDAQSGAKNIGISYVQTLSLLATFPIAWPQIFKFIFRVGGAVAAMGQHLVNLKCATPSLSEADVFYLIRLVWAVLPLLIPLCCVLLWLAVSRFREALCGWDRLKAFQVRAM
jgi:hypothetical protein